MPPFKRMGSLALAAALATALSSCSGTDRPVRGSGTIEMDEVDVASLHQGSSPSLADGSHRSASPVAAHSSHAAS